MPTEDSGDRDVRMVDLKWSVDLQDRTSDDQTIGPARRVNVAGRCAECWGQCLALADGTGKCIGLTCRECEQRVDGEHAQRELKRMEVEAARNLSRVRVGLGSEYDETAPFVLKILPDMDRDRAGFSRRVAEAMERASSKPRRHMLTRRDFDAAGTPGLFYLQASALLSGVEALPREISAISPADFDFEDPESVAEARVLDAPGQLQITGSGSLKRREHERLTDRMGAAMVAGFGSAFACELGMKAILLTRLDEADKSHDLWKLYESLPSDCRERLQGDFPAIASIMSKYGHTFDRWRYFEPGAAQDALSILVNLEQIRGLEKAARVILDECVIAGLDYDIDVRYQYHFDFNGYISDDRTVTTALDEDSVSTKVSMEIGGHESAIAWEGILPLSSDYR